MRITQAKSQHLSIWIGGNMEKDAIKFWNNLMSDSDACIIEA